MTTLLVRNATVLVTMDDHRREIPGGGLFVRDGFIEQVGASRELPGQADEVLDLSGHLVLPGLVNTHHHFYQTLTRAVPAAQNANLFNWLKTLYPIWARMTPEDIYHFHPDRAGRAGAFWLHHRFRSPVSVPQRLPAG